MENQDIKTTAHAIMHFSAFIVTEDSAEENFRQHHVINYALSYILRLIKQNEQDANLQNHYREVFWYIQEKYNK